MSPGYYVMMSSQMNLCSVIWKSHHHHFFMHHFLQEIPYKKCRQQKCSQDTLYKHSSFINFILHFPLFPFPSIFLCSFFTNTREAQLSFDILGSLINILCMDILSQGAPPLLLCNSTIPLQSLLFHSHHLIHFSAIPFYRGLSTCTCIINFRLVHRFFVTLTSFILSR